MFEMVPLVRRSMLTDSVMVKLHDVWSGRRGGEKWRCVAFGCLAALCAACLRLLSGWMCSGEASWSSGAARRGRSLGAGLGATTISSFEAVVRTSSISRSAPPFDLRKGLEADYTVLLDISEGR